MVYNGNGSESHLKPDPGALPGFGSFYFVRLQDGECNSNG
jgi:hypothetical protein